MALKGVTIELAFGWTTYARRQTPVNPRNERNVFYMMTLEFQERTHR